MYTWSVSLAAFSPLALGVWLSPSSHAAANVTSSNVVVPRGQLAVFLPPALPLAQAWPSSRRCFSASSSTPSCSRSSSATGFGRKG